MREPIRTWTDTGMMGTATVELFDTGRTRGGKYELAYTLTLTPDSGEPVAFEGNEFYPSPLIAIDSDESLGALLGFFAYYGEAIRYSDDDADVPQDLTAAQREALVSWHDDLTLFGCDLEGD